MLSITAAASLPVVPAWGQPRMPSPPVAGRPLARPGSEAPTPTPNVLYQLRSSTR